MSNTRTIFDTFKIQNDRPVLVSNYNHICFAPLPIECNYDYIKYYVSLSEEPMGGGFGEVKSGISKIELAKFWIETLNSWDCFCNILEINSKNIVFCVAAQNSRYKTLLFLTLIRYLCEFMPIVECLYLHKQLSPSIKFVYFQMLHIIGPLNHIGFNRGHACLSYYSMCYFSSLAKFKRNISENIKSVHYAFMNPDGKTKYNNLSIKTPDKDLCIQAFSPEFVKTVIKTAIREGIQKLKAAKQSQTKVLTFNPNK